MTALDAFSNIEVAVFGDLIADVWLTGEAHTLSREAPVATVDVLDKRVNPGGAANAAANLAALGARVILLGTVGDDETGDELCRSLEQIGVNTNSVERTSLTHTKTRVVVDGAIVARFDQRRRDEDPTPQLDTSIPLLIADYDMGCWQKQILGRVLTQRPAFVAVDSHHPEIWRELSPDLLTPNWYEAATLMPTWDGQCHRSQHLRRHREEILMKSGATRALITLDRDGSVLLTPQNGWFVGTDPAPQRNTIGAGDTATAALMLSLLAGIPDERALMISSAAAKVAVSRPGTTVVHQEELITIDLRRNYGRSYSNDQSTSTALGDTSLARITGVPL